MLSRTPLCTFGNRHIPHSALRIPHSRVRNPQLRAGLLALLSATALSFAGVGPYAYALSIDGDGYTVEYSTADERDAVRVADAAARALPELKSRFGPKPSKPARIVLADSVETFNETVGSEMPAWTSGAAIGSRNLIVLKSRRLAFRRGTNMSKTVRHELTHIVLGANYRMDRLPRWLNEGIAMWQADEPTFRGEFNLAASALFGRLVPIEKLDREFKNARNDVASTCYGESRSLVDFIIAQHGEDAVVELLEASRSAATDEAFARVLGRTPAQLYREWRRWMQRYVLWYSVLSGVGLFWLMALFVVVVYIRNRIRGRRKLAEWDEQDPVTHGSPF